MTGSVFAIEDRPRARITVEVDVGGVDHGAYTTATPRAAAEGATDPRAVDDNRVAPNGALVIARPAQRTPRANVVKA